MVNIYLNNTTTLALKWSVNLQQIRAIRFFLVFSFFLITIYGYTQKSILGVPRIASFEKDDYRGSAQNWETLTAFDQMFFANNSCLLSYDGNSWKSHSMNNAIMRSISYNGGSRIYCAGQNELGYFEPNNSGELIYTSLRDSIDIKDDNLSEIWNINTHSDTLWFSSENNVIFYSNGNSTIRSFSGFISCLSRIEDDIWINVTGSGLFRSNKGEIIPIKGGNLFEDKLVVEIVKGPDDVVFVVTNKNGVYEYKNKRFENLALDAVDFLDNLSSAAYHEDHGLYLGSAVRGVIGLGKDLRCHTRLDRKNGLQHNSVNCLGFSKEGDLWIGENNGIDYLSLGSNVSIFHPDNELEGTIYDIAKWKGKMYVSTSTGLYTIEERDYYNPLENQQFELIKGTGGQNWGLDIIDNQLYCAHHDAALLIRETNDSERIPGCLGSWRFIKLSHNKVAIGHYTGVNIYSLINGELVFEYKVPGMNETSRVMTLDSHNNLWVSHPYDFVYRISFTENFETAEVHKFDSKKGFRTNKDNYVYGINGACYLTNETGAYRYSNERDSFVRADELNNLFNSENHIRGLIQIEDEVWCITDRSTSKLEIILDGLNMRFSKTDYRDLVAVENYVGGFENLYKYDEETLFLCTEKGVREYRLDQYEQSPLQSRINKIQLTTRSDSIVYGGYGPVPDVVLPPRLNAFVFDFGSNRIDPNAGIEYSFQLEGLESKWAPWSEISSKEYNNVPFGTYVFKVKARSLYGEESPITQVNIEVQAPWYKSNLAVLFFISLFLLSFASILLFQKRRFKTKAAVLESEIERTEEEMEVIKKEKLEEQIRFKNKELAMATMNLLQKDETLKAIKTDIEIVESRIKDPQARKEVRKIIGLLRSDDRLQEDWDNFSLHFDQVHHDFIKRLRVLYPSLTPKDQKLCAYLRMNLSTKEIAPLLRISVRGIEISRYRLRKKMDLDKDVNLNACMMDF